MNTLNTLMSLLTWATCSYNGVQQGNGDVITFATSFLTNQRLLYNSHMYISFCHAQSLLSEEVDPWHSLTQYYSLNYLIEYSCMFSVQTVTYSPTAARRVSQRGWQNSWWFDHHRQAGFIIRSLIGAEVQHKWWSQCITKSDNEPRISRSWINRPRIVFWKR